MYKGFRKLATRHKWFLVSCVVVLALSYIRFSRGEFQQDNYLGYADSLPGRLESLSYYDTRLFPGLPLLILFGKLFLGSSLVSGYLTVFLSFVGSYILLYKFTASRYSFLPLVFPPAMLSQATLIATEYLTIFSLLAGIYLLQRKNYAGFMFLAGFSFWFRPIGVATLAGALIHLARQGKLKLLYRRFIFFVFPLALFFLYNFYIFGIKDILRPFIAYTIKAPVPVSFPLLQIVKDLPRAYTWGWYRIFVSGLAYLLIYVALMIFSYLRTRKNSTELNLLSFTIALCMSLYVFSFSYVPFLENLGRYLVPLLPLFWLIGYKKLAKSILAQFLLAASILIVLV